MDHHQKLKQKGEGQRSSGRGARGNEHEEIPVQSSQIPPASHEHKSASQPTRTTKKQRKSGRSSAQTLPRSTCTPVTANQPTTAPSATTQFIGTPASAPAEIGYQGPRNAALMGDKTGANSSRNKRPTIPQVLKKIRERSKKRPWRP
ncbi:hypothetical protein Salat_1416500 [Sesamum alatum]|uniref:Uncharacterized protein n=1 Tax=Sesamum alatum TaxID=300844 RepID=A0AAE1YAJ6_9LAMI|nr:hypothetical protein Salat_1416500 [Sesamum alatum]